MTTEVAFTDAAELLTQVRATPLSPEGILALVRRLDDGQPDIVRGAFALAHENDEVYAGALLAMAARTAQIRVRPEDVRPFLPELSPRLVPVVVGLVSGNRLRLVMDLLGDVALDRETEATLLLIATCLLDGDPPPTALLARIRTMARRELPLAAGMLVGAAAALAVDPDTASVAERWLSGAEQVRNVLTRETMRSLEGPVVAVLPPPRRKAEAPRVAAKVGRNDPCPCGSGKKYKKCCAGKAGPANDASAASSSSRSPSGPLRLPPSRPIPRPIQPRPRWLPATPPPGNR